MLNSFLKKSNLFREHSDRLKYILVIGFILLNLFQSYFTELAHDEAYYWVYAQNMDWGYFDHPPMIAFLIKLGSFIFPGELGVRFFIVIINALTLLVLYHLAGRKNFNILLALLSGITVFHIYGFIAVPDAPLLLFTALFFLCYKRFLDQQNGYNIVWLSLVIALLLYSKYHGVLVLFFTLTSNLSLLKKRSFYLVIILSVVCYSPHIIWQIINDYPSYKYHVLNKSQSPYNPLDSLWFVLGQLLIYGPLISGILFYSAYKVKVRDKLTSALKFTLFGFIIFFIISTLNAKVEPNWTVPILIPLIILSLNYLEFNVKLKKLTLNLALISCVLMLLVRIHLSTNIFPNQISKNSEFHGWKNWANDIKFLAGEKPVVFMNSYQKAAKYYFYSKDKTLSLNNIMYRRNQFDLWPIESEIQGDDVMLIPNYAVKGFTSFTNDKETFYYGFIPNFRSYNKIWIEPDLEMEFDANRDTMLLFSMLLINHFDKPVDFDLNPDYPVRVVCSMFRHEEFIGNQVLTTLNGYTLNDSLKISISIKTPKNPEIYYWRFSLQAGWLPPSINSNLYRVIVKK